MMSVAVSDHLLELRKLVKRLTEEHREFASDMANLNRETLSENETNKLQELFIAFKDNLTDHVLVEEFEVYPELMRKNLFDLTVSAIMQQHHDVIASLGKMELSLRLRSLPEFRAALDELAGVLRTHQPAEEERVFAIAVR